MARTRPSGLSIVDDESAIVSEEIAHIDTRGRINFLPRWRERIPWLAKQNTGDTQALMVFAEPGLISIREWALDGPRIQKRYEELANSPDEDATEALRLIQSRYRRLIILRNERTSLGEAALAHLGLFVRLDFKSFVYASTFPSSLELLSPDLRNARLLAGSAHIDDLP
jgi:FMN phosphatase YigB (HAD superfamily)